MWTLAGSRCIATLTGHRQPIRRLEIAAGRLFSGGCAVGCLPPLLLPPRFVCQPHPPSLHTPVGLPAAGAKHVRVWSLSEGFPCLARLQVADLRGSNKALAVGGDMLYVGGQSCQVSAYRLAPELLDTPGPPAPRGGAPGSQRPPPAEYTVPEGSDAAGPDSGSCVPCGPNAGFGIRAVVGTASPPAAASPLEHSHCGSITALVVCGPYVFSASSDSTIRVWRAGSLEFVRVLRGHRGSVLALYGGAGVVLRWAHGWSGPTGVWGTVGDGAARW